MFYPTAGTMTFSELLLGLLPITAPVQWLFGNPVLSYNIAVVVSFPLCALAAHALAFELTGRHDAALLAGLVFGFSPYRATEFGHVQMLSYYWAPVALLALHHYRRDSRRAWLAIFSIAWLLQSLCNGYAIFHLAVMIPFWAVWFSVTRRDFLAVMAAWVCGSLPLVPILYKYHEVHRGFRLERSIADITRFSADVRGLFTSPHEAVLLGDRFLSDESNALFPGLTILIILVAATVLHMRRQRPERIVLSLARRILAAFAILCASVAASVFVIGPWKLGALSVGHAQKPFTLALWAWLLFSALGPRWRRVWRERSSIGFYGLAAVTSYVLALGPEPRVWGSRAIYKAPYAWLMELPGFDSIRVPARFAMLAVLCLAVLAALTYARWSSWSRGRDRLIWAGLCLGLIADAWIKVPLHPVPPQGANEQWPSVKAILELPLRPESDAPALYRSIRYGLPLVNGTSGYAPPHYTSLTHALTSGDVAAITELGQFGPIGIAIDRSAPDGAELEAAISRLEAVTPLKGSSAWARFLMGQTSHTRPKPGRGLEIKNSRGNPHASETGRLFDGRPETMWSSGQQKGSEELLLELDEPRAVGAVVFHMGACPFGFPRDLAVDVSDDENGWTTVWRGRTAVATVRAALDDPAHVPMLIQIGAARARFIRLRQLGRDPNVPWCVGEITVHEPR